MSLLRSASTVSSLTLISRITGLVRELLVAAIFGASALTDAFNIAFRIPNFLRRLFAEGAFSQAFVPILAATRAEHGEAATHQLIHQTATLLAWVLLATSVLGVALAPLLVWLLASGLGTAEREPAIMMARIMFPYIACMSLVALASGVLNTYRRFALPAFTPVLLNVAMISAAALAHAPTSALATWLLLHGIPRIYLLAAGVMLGGVMQLALQWWGLKRLGILPRLSWRLSGLLRAARAPGTQRILKLMLPALFGVGVAQVSLILNTQIASYLRTGSVSWLTYADRLMEFPTAMLGVALAVVLMPALAAAKVRIQEAPHDYTALLDWGLRLVVVLALPCAVALFVFAKPLVATLYHYGAFGLEDVSQTSRALAFYGVGLVSLIAIKVLAAGYYAQQNIKTPVKAALAALITTQLFNVFTVPAFAHAGLALSISLGACLNAALLCLGLMRSGFYRPHAGWRRLFVSAIVASSVLGLGLIWASTWVDWQVRSGLRLPALLGIVSAGALLYLGTLWCMGLRLQQFLKPQ